MYPGATFHYPHGLRLGYQGHDVWALQVNLNDWRQVGALPRLAEDGNFGPQTDRGVRTFQRRRLAPTLGEEQIDGVAGVTTQRYLALDLMRPAQASYSLPDGLMRSFIEGESGWFVGCVAWGTVTVGLGPHLGEENTMPLQYVPAQVWSARARELTQVRYVDCGWLQDHVREPQFSHTRFEEVFRGTILFPRHAQLWRERKNDYYTRLPAHKKTDELAWYLTVLRHNWPSAVSHIINGDTNWQYSEYVKQADGSYQKVLRWMDEPAVWITNIGVPGVRTGFEWADHYVRTKSSYVEVWTP
jgi:hypothetical protein